MVRWIFLTRDRRLGLDRFYEGKKGRVLFIHEWSITFFTILYTICFGYYYVDGVKNYTDNFPNPLIVFLLLAWAHGGDYFNYKAFQISKTV